MNARRLSMVTTILVCAACGTMSQAQQTMPASGDPDMGIIASKSIFLRDRRPPILPGKQIEDLPIPLPERLVLRGVVFQDNEFRAFIEGPERGTVKAIRVGDTIADGEVTEIRMDGIGYRTDGATTWIGPGKNMTGRVSKMMESRR